MWRRGIFFIISIILIYTPCTKASSGGLDVRVSDADAILSSQLEATAKTDAIAKLETILKTLNKKQQQYKNDIDFVEYLYYFTHRKLLKKYDQYASLSETLSEGTYDCLTATTLYSMLLTELSIEHEVVETNYHIYILVNPDSKKEILLETTDPTYGLISNPDDIEKYKTRYRNSNKEMELGQIDLNLNVERRLKNKELIGLLYYNQSVNEINKGNWVEANELASKANEYYPNIRISRLLEYIDSSYRSASL